MWGWWSGCCGRGSEAGGNPKAEVRRPTVDGKIAPLGYSHDPFPLTPALSLREREKQRPRATTPSGSGFGMRCG